MTGLGSRQLCRQVTFRGHILLRTSKTLCAECWTAGVWRAKSTLSYVTMPNVTMAMDDAQMKSLGCVAHTVQLAVKKAMESQRAIEDAVSVCREIAGHFSHSCLAKDRLWTIQQSLADMEQNTIIQVRSFYSIIMAWALVFIWLIHLKYAPNIKTSLVLVSASLSSPSLFPLSKCTTPSLFRSWLKPTI